MPTKTTKYADAATAPQTHTQTNRLRPTTISSPIGKSKCAQSSTNSCRCQKRTVANTSENQKMQTLKVTDYIWLNKCTMQPLLDSGMEEEQDYDFEKFDCVRLNETLGHFYVDLRKGDGERYKASSLESIRHGINRYLKAPPHSKTFDIVKDSPFNDSNANFKAVLAESKRFGLGDVEHFPVINEVDRETLYTSMYLSSTTPTGLANKVQFDIRLYFCRRGIENMHNMTKSTFAIKTNKEPLTIR
ncbi:unnamed protein product [Mytilus edulis]|uniref:Uncharacterized protein n=1 Tax=Mytilus edulis TaxID=6550 RepID=A0A8S3SIL2_MYTED|nr:unnamed protein product [Mytilus edulis]